MKTITKKDLRKAGISWDLSGFEDTHDFDYEIGDCKIGIYFGDEGFIYGDIKIVDNIEENRVQIFFPGKPEQEMRTKLKRHGFRWTPNNGCWQSYPTYNSRCLIQELIKRNEKVN